MVDAQLSHINQNLFRTDPYGGDRLEAKSEKEDWDERHDRWSGRSSVARPIPMAPSPFGQISTS